MNKNKVKELGTPLIKKDSHIVPAFTASEGGQDGKSGWIFRDIFKEFRQIEQTHELELGKRFPVEVFQNIEMNNVSQPLLKHFLDKYAVHPLPSYFDFDACLETCRNTISEMQSHRNTDQYIEMALNQIKMLWAEAQMRDHLTDINNWLIDNPATPAGSEVWLREKLQIESLIALGQARFDTLNDKAKLEISQATILLDINRKTYLLIYNRFLNQNESASEDDSLEPVINKLTKQVSNQQAWQDLLAATYGAITWLIFQQAGQAVQTVREILEGTSGDG